MSDTKPTATAADNDAAAQEDAMKLRILSHMSKDHTLSLYDYLAYYSKIELNPNKPGTSIRMKDIDVDHFELEFTTPNAKGEAGKPMVALVMINPPMDSLADARGTLVKMATEAATKRGFDTIRITEYAPPITIFEWFVLTFVASQVPPISNAMGPFTMSVSSGLYKGGLTEKYPWAIPITILLIHLGEMATVVRPLLNKYRVPAPTRYWWYIDALFGGLLSINRFKKLVASKKH